MSCGLAAGRSRNRRLARLAKSRGSHNLLAREV
jgi:hypothetical protein